MPIGLAVLFFYCASKQGMGAGEIELTEEQMAELSTHYGTYRITEFCDTKYTT